MQQKLSIKHYIYLNMIVFDLVTLVYNDFDHYSRESERESPLGQIVRTINYEAS